MSHPSVSLKEDLWLSTLMGRTAFSLVRHAPLIKDEVIDALRALPKGAFVSLRLSSALTLEVAMLQSVGMSVVDFGFEFARPRREISAKTEGVRFATPSDEGAVREIARSAFSRSRFHLDPKIPSEIANAIKEEWAGNFFKGARGTHMVVAEASGSVVGFMQLILRDRTLIIDLIGVQAASRGKGLGGAMICFAERRIEDFDILRVGTQGMNVSSARFYGRLGLEISDTQYVFHYHKEF